MKFHWFFASGFGEENLVLGQSLINRPGCKTSRSIMHRGVSWREHLPSNLKNYLTLCQATARSTKSRKVQSYKGVFIWKRSTFAYYNLPCLEVFFSLITKTNPKVCGTLKSLPKIVSKRNHQEECYKAPKPQSVLLLALHLKFSSCRSLTKLFRSKAEFVQIERLTSKPRCCPDRSWN